MNNVITKLGMIVFSLFAFCSTSTAQEIVKMGDVMELNGSYYDKAQLDVLLRSDQHSTADYDEYLYQLKINKNIKKAAVVSTLAGVAVGTLFVGHENRDTGSFGISEKGFRLFLWSATLVGTGAVLGIVSLSSKSKAKKSLRNAIDAYNYGNGYGFEEKIDVGLEMTSNGMGLKYTF